MRGVVLAVNGQTSKAPRELYEYQFYKEFGWTPFELYTMPSVYLSKLAFIMNTIATKEKADMESARRQSGR